MALAIERGFTSIEEGQVHYRVCGDRSLPPLIMFHASPGSSYSVMPLMAELGKARRVIAIDTLGNGDSAAPRGEAPDIAYFADAHGRAIKSMGIDSADIYGTHTGAAICIEVAIAYPKLVKQIIMDGISLFDSKTKDTLMGGGHAPEIKADLAGTQLLQIWTMVRDAHLFWPWWNRVNERRRNRALPSADQLHEEVLELLKAWRTYHKSYRAALLHPRRERLPHVRHRTLVACSPTDPLVTYVNEAVSLLKDAKGLITPGEETPQDIVATAKLMSEFLNNG